MWYVFPQISGLGHSETAEHYSISCVNEAKEYVQHPILGSRLLECIDKVLKIEGKSAEQIFGYPDNLKFLSCLTLFSQVDRDNDIFQQALDKYFDGRPDPRTLNAM